MSLSQFRRPDNGFERSLPVSIGDIISDGTGKKDNILRDISDFVPEIFRIQVPDIISVYGNSSLLGKVIFEKKFDESRFS